MSDLRQTEERGVRADDDPIDWYSTSEHVVPASNRRRILDREHDRSYTPGDDGWLTSPYGTYEVINGRVVQGYMRIRWMPHSAPEPEATDLDGGA